MHAHIRSSLCASLAQRCAALSATLLVASAAQADVVIGQSASLTGPSARHSRQFVNGAKACVAGVNRRGGVAGRAVRLEILDDAGDPQQARTNTQRLVDEFHANAVFGFTTRPTAEAGLEVAQATHTVYFAPASGGGSLYDTGSKYVFHLRPGYATEYDKIVETLSTTGAREFAAVVNTDDRSQSNERAVREALSKRGLAPRVIAQVPRTSVDVGAATSAILAANPQVLIIAASGRSVAPLLTALRKAGYTGQFATMSLVGADLPRDLGETAHGVIVTNVVPNPSRTVDPLVREALRELRDLSPDATLTFSSLEGYASACTLVNLIRRAGPSARGDGLVEAIEQAGDVSWPGSAIRISYSPHRHTGSTFVDVGLVNADGHWIN